MGRSTVYNNITTPEKIDQVLPENLELMNDFLEYLQSIDRAQTTIKQYEADLKIFWVWNLENNSNKEFIKITKREFSRFQNHAINVWQWSPKRTRRVKSVISSMSNFIENILDDEEEFAGYRAIIHKIENPVNEAVREKTIFEDKELQGLLDKLLEDEDYEKACMIALAMYSGRRKSELPRFKVSYFDKENVKFGALYKTPEKVKTKGHGSKGKMLDLYVLKKDFDPYLRLWLKKREELGIQSEWLFPKHIGLKEYDGAEQISTSTLDSWADQFSRYFGKSFYWHSLRHYWTTMLLKNNLPSAVVQEITGWASADMISVYDDRDSDETLEKYFDENGIKQIEEKSVADI